MPTRHRDLSLQRSKTTWICANNAKDELEESFSDYVNLVKKIPTILSNNGLGQTLAFLNSKPKNDTYKKLFKQIQQWLAERIYKWTALTTPNIIALVQNGSVDRYRWATTELLQFITWLKLHSSSLDIGSLENDNSNDSTTDNNNGTVPFNSTHSELE